MEVNSSGFIEGLDNSKPEYWNDFTIFIKEVERLSLLSPSDLFESYESLIEGLESNKIYTSIYNQDQADIDHDEDSFGNLINCVHEVVKSISLKGNLLHTAFSYKVEELDERLRKFIKPAYFKGEIWITNFKLVMINWNQFH